MASQHPNHRKWLPAAMDHNAFAADGRMAELTQAHLTEGMPDAVARARALFDTRPPRSAQ
jgi:hypothetical protein